jgi:hypothetical protein
MINNHFGSFSPQEVTRAKANKDASIAKIAVKSIPMLYNVYRKADSSFNVSPNSATFCTACFVVSPTGDPHAQSDFKIAYGNSAKAATYPFSHIGFISYF